MQRLERQTLEVGAELLAELRAQGDPRVLGHGAIFDQYQHANKGNVGFYERFMAGEKMPTGWVNPTDYEKNGD